MNEIICLDEIIDDRSSIMKEIRDIFFLSTSVKFESEHEKDEFFLKWAAIYFARWADFTFLFIERGIVVGYICGTPCSRSFLKI
jgi:hypothetical protein